MKTVLPALIALSTTIKAPPAMTMNIVSADLNFLSLSASTDSIKICL
ncbi:MAG TPA: hypothetical protein VN922_10410 [Bacteroidia bacterium]|nr:hypothetical protein [Bacteroidia bacterium]